MFRLIYINKQKNRQTVLTLKDRGYEVRIEKKKDKKKINLFLDQRILCQTLMQADWVNLMDIWIYPNEKIE